MVFHAMEMNLRLVNVSMMSKFFKFLMFKLLIYVYEFNLYSIEKMGYSQLLFD